MVESSTSWCGRTVHATGEWTFDGKENGGPLPLEFTRPCRCRTREKRDQAKKLLAAHTDPATQRKLDKIASNEASRNTFRLISQEWVEKLIREGRSPRTVDKISWLLELAYPAIGDQPIASIIPTQLLTVLRTVEARGHYETARRLRSTCGQVFRYAIATARAERDPSADLRGALTAPKVRHHAAVVDPKGIGALLRAIEGYEGQPITSSALKLAPLVFCSTRRAAIR